LSIPGAHRTLRAGMPKKGGKKGKGKKKEEDWGAIAREQYVTIEVRHARRSPARPAHRC